MGAGKGAEGDVAARLDRWAAVLSGMVMAVDGVGGARDERLLKRGREGEVIGQGKGRGDLSIRCVGLCAVPPVRRAK